MSKEILNNTFQKKIQNFIKKNLKNLIVLLILSILIFFSFLLYTDFKKKMK